ncbi:MAG: YkgJ family cysteine cluster protein [Planctomycetota bacterium]|jgi:Fe-S-cluster containining protein
MAKKKKPLCNKCTGLCCRYFALPIETPEDRGDYDDIKWFLCHEDISVFVEDGDWYINIDNKCKYLTNGDHQCKIYSKRPRICRGYHTRDCDLVEGEYDYELHFTDDKQMEEYIRIKFDNNIKKNLAAHKKRLHTRKKVRKK